MNIKEQMPSLSFGNPSAFICGQSTPLSRSVALRLN
jgi:hypothetical protein